MMARLSAGIGGAAGRAHRPPRALSALQQQADFSAYANRVRIGFIPSDVASHDAVVEGARWPSGPLRTVPAVECVGAELHGPEQAGKD